MGHRRDRVARMVAARTAAARARLWWLSCTLAACHATAQPIVVVPTPPLRPAPIFEPSTGRTVVTETSIEILEGISFVGNTAQVAPEATRILDAIAESLAGNSNILLVEVRGHSDWAERDRVRRAELSIERAEAVIAELVHRGIAPARLQPYGASDSELISTIDPVANRRVDLVILARASD
jgi:outer membrane protein OmpA-like peptidoglycan-associated protein